jgi:FkbM family methyltransferase
MNKNRLSKKFGHLKKQDPFIYEEIFDLNVYDMQESEVRGKTVIDVGANLGFFSVLCSYFGAKNVFAVEPQPDMYFKLLSNVENSKNVRTFQVAVTDKKGDSVKINSRGGESTIYFHDSTDTSFVHKVDTVTVEDLVTIEQLQIKDRDMVLKIDAEGAEYDILLNMSDEMFERFGIIFVEIHSNLHPVYKGFDIIVNKLEEKGFFCSHKMPLKNKVQGVWTDGDQANFKFVKGKKPKDIRVLNDRPSVLCCISTRDRYFNTLPLAISSIANQTVVPDELVIFDDGEQKDLRKEELYVHLFRTLDIKNIKWKVDFGKKIGQHHNHERVNTMGYDLVWRVDDDEVVEPSVLEKLLKHFIDPKVGAVGGAIITPGGEQEGGTNRLVDIFDTPNLQWSRGSGSYEVEHLYSSFVYRANKAHYCLELSPVAHREETIFSHELMLAGYRLIVDKGALTYHYRSSSGGIRSHTDKTMYDWDEAIFVRKMLGWGYKIVVLDCGLGDHFAFLHCLPKLLKKHEHVIIGCCYPEVFEDYKSVAKIIPVGFLVNVVQGDNIYKWMIENGWGGNLVDAFAKKYGVLS